MINFEEDELTQETSKIDFSEEEVPQLSEEAISEKGKIIQIATDGSRTPYTEPHINFLIRNGGENDVRRMLAEEELLRMSQTKNEIIGQLLASGDTSQEVVEAVSTLSATEFNTPENVQKRTGDIIERKFAERLTLEAYSRENFSEEEERYVGTAMDITNELVTKTAVVKGLIAEASSNFSDKSFLGKVGSIGITAIPFVSHIGTNRAFDGERSSKFLQGSNQAEQAAELWKIQDPVEFKAVLKAEYEERREEYGDAFALNWLNAFINYTSTDKFIDNAFSALDVGTFGLAGAVRAIGLGKGLIKGASMKKLKAADIAAEAGDLKSSALLSFAENSKSAGALPKEFDGLKRTLDSVFDFEKAFGKTDNLSSTAINRLTLAANNRAGIILEAVTKNINIDRVDPTELNTLAEEAFDSLMKTYTSAQHNILDVDFAKIPGKEIIAAEDTVTNTNQLILRFGRSNGTLFESKKGAINWAKKYGHLTDDFEVKQKGSKYFIELRTNIREDSLNKVVIPTNAKTPRSLFRGLYSDSYLVSPSQVADRAVVTSRVESLGRLIEPLGEPITKLSKSAADEVEEILEINNVFVDAAGERGMWFNAEELVSNFYKRFGKMPTEDQIDAYFATRQISDMEFFMMNLNYTKQMLRDGFENIKLNLGGSVPDSFVGRVIDDINWNEDSYTKFRVVDDQGKVIYKGTNNTSHKAKLQEFKDQGYVIIQPVDGFMKIADDSTNLIVAKTPSRSMLTMQQISYRAGGHVMNESPFYIKSADIHVTDKGSRVYRGDITIANAVTEKQAKEIAEHLRAVQKMLQDNNLTAARSYIADNLPANSIDEVLDWFESGKIPKTGKISATKSGQRTLDRADLVKGVDFDIDGTLNPYNYKSQMSGRFIGRRDARDVDTIIREGNSLSWNHETNKLRPFVALNEGLKNATRGLIMDDYVAKSTESYIREFLPILEGVSERQFRNNPLYYLNNQTFKAGARPEEVTAARAFAQAVTNIIGQQTEVSIKLDIFKQKILDWTFDKGGPKSKMYKVVDERLLPTVEDPTTFFRSIAFQTKMGLFNTVQLALQSQIVTNIASISGPKKAFQALAAHTYSHGLFLNPRPNMLKDADARLAKFGWKKGWFEESHKAGLDSGWFDVGGDTAVLDTYNGPNLMKGKVGKFLDTGLVFYKKGEQIGRLTAWHSAYLEWKTLNPNKVLRRQDLQKLMVRARDLSANMTRDQNAFWQRGLPSVTTQFLGFQVRLMEQLVSPRSRLTGAERLKLFAGISLMYGMPDGVGAGFGVWPVNETVEKILVENGWDETVEDNLLLKAMKDGILSVGIGMTTGMDFDTSRLSPGGLSVFKDIFRGDKDWYEIFGGASAGIIADILSETVPYLNADDGIEANAYEVLDVFKNISTVNQAIKLSKAINTGKWLTNNETYMGDITLQEAFISSLTGLELERFTDAFLKLEVGKDAKASFDSTMKEVTKNYARAFRAAEANDFESYETFIRRAKSIGIPQGFTLNDFRKASERGRAITPLTEAAEENYQKYIVERNERKERMKEGTQ
jgi:hypothetical protein